MGNMYCNVIYDIYIHTCSGTIIPPFAWHPQVLFFVLVGSLIVLNMSRGYAWLGMVGPEWLYIYK